MRVARLRKALYPAVISVTLLAAPALFVSGCDTSPSNSPQISFQLNEGLSSWLTARDRAVSSVLLARDQLKPKDLRVIETDYSDTVGDANGWIESVSLGIRAATLDDPQADESYRQKAVISSAKVDALVQDVRNRVLASNSSSGLQKTSGLADMTGAGEFIMKTMDWLLRHKAEEAQLKQMQQAERDRLADEVLRCGTWPNWQTITAQYKSNCETITPGARPAPITLPTSGPSR